MPNRPMTWGCRRGPYKSLTAAKSAIAVARDEAAPASLEDRRPSEPAEKTASQSKSKAERPKKPEEPKSPRNRAGSAISSRTTGGRRPA